MIPQHFVVTWLRGLLKKPSGLLSILLQTKSVDWMFFGHGLFRFERMDSANLYPAIRKDLKSIQFLRFVAAAIVVFVHSTEAIGKYFPATASDVEKFVGLGASGVSIFFVISGFVMVHASFREDRTNFSSSEFMSRRIARIYPIYILYSAIYLTFYWALSGENRFSPTEIGGSLLLLPGYSSNIIGPGWTLSFEMYFYICFAIFMSFSIGRGLVAMTVFFFSAIALRLVIVASDPIVHVLTNPLLVEFLLGAWIAYFIRKMPRQSSWVGYIALTVAMAGFSIGIAYGYTRWPALIVWGIPSGFLIAGLVTLERNGVLSWIIKRLAPLGDSSYSLYLLHIVLIDMFFVSVARYFVLDSHSAVCLAVLVTIPCILISAAAYEYVERYLTIGALKMIRRFLPASSGELRSSGGVRSK